MVTTSSLSLDLSSFWILLRYRSDRWSVRNRHVRCSRARSSIDPLFCSQFDRRLYHLDLRGRVFFVRHLLRLALSAIPSRFRDENPAFGRLSDWTRASGASLPPAVLLVVLEIHEIRLVDQSAKIRRNGSNSPEMFSIADPVARKTHDRGQRRTFGEISGREWRRVSRSKGALFIRIRKRQDSHFVSVLSFLFICVFLLFVVGDACFRSVQREATRLYTGCVTLVVHRMLNID